MNFESILRKGLMWKSRIKWMLIGFFVGYAFAWGGLAFAQSCTGDPISFEIGNNGCFYAYPTTSTCATDINCTWDGDSCEVSLTICQSQITTSTCEGIMENYYTNEECIWSSYVEPETPTTTTVTSTYEILVIENLQTIIFSMGIILFTLTFCIGFLLILKMRG